MTVSDKNAIVIDKEDLSGFDYCCAYLAMAKMRECKLVGTDFYKATMFGANLSGSDLTRANLAGADMRWVNLSGADLSGAYLLYADLRYANLNWTKYDDRTVWPDGFTPSDRMVKK